METRTNDVLKALNGDNAAMECLYNETYPKLRAVTVSILKNEDDAEDIIQDTYIKAFSTLKQLDDASKFDAWLCRIASNKCKDYLKKHKPVLFSDMGNGDEDEDPYEWSIEDESGAYNPEEVAITDDTRRQLMELINSLPDEQRICLVYYAVEEMKISEIAQMMEVSESTVKSRLKYAKDKMKTKIEELEKKGVKIRSVSGFALIPFLHYLFATEAKAATAISFSAISEAVAAVAKASSTATTTSASTVAKTVVTEVAKQTGTKAAVGLGAKIASLPLAAKIAAGVVAGIVAAVVAVSVPVAIYNAVADGDEYHETDVEQTHENDGRDENDGRNDISDRKDKENDYDKIAEEDDFDAENLNSMIDFDETVIVDEEDYRVKVLNIRIDENYNYILESEVTNKLSNDIQVFVYPCFIDGVYSNSTFDVISRTELDNSRIEANKTERADIIVHNPDLINYYKDFSEIRLRIQHAEVDGFNVLANHESVYAPPIYPFGKENKKEFMIGNHYNQPIYTDNNVSIYTVDFLAVETSFDDFYYTAVLYLENKTNVGMYYNMDNLLINGEKVSIHYIGEKDYKNDYVYNVDASYDEAYIPKNSSVFYKISFRQSDVRDDADIWDVEEIETFRFDGKMFEAGNEKNAYFEGDISINPEIIKRGYTLIVDCDFCHEMRSGEIIADYGYDNAICFICKEELEEE